MITTHQKRYAENFRADFSLYDWHMKQAEAFNAAAQNWRTIAHTCQMAKDHDGVRMAHHFALDNEMWAKDSERKAAGILHTEVVE